MRIEVWKEIVGFGGGYEVSNLGNVRSWLSPSGRGVRRKVPLLLKFREMLGGYVGVTLRGKTHLVHALVLEAFVGARPGHSRKIHACHNDGNPKNNYSENLRWATVSENHADKLLHGTDFRGERNPAVRLSQSQVNEIKECLKVAKWGDVSRLAAEYGVDQTTISDIKTGRSWGEAT
jgi:hypothetical protein